MMMFLKTIFFLYLFVNVVAGFVRVPQPMSQQRRSGSIGSSPCSSSSLKLNPLKEISDMFNNFDDVVDDFLNKRMGNGEIFYGQRKYKPSGRENTEGSYSGMGMSDKARIDAARAYREEKMEMRRLREEGLNRQQ